jgi:hypothetical protein
LLRQVQQPTETAERHAEVILTNGKRTNGGDHFLKKVPEFTNHGD